MNNKLVVVADLGSFKAYKLARSSLHSTPRLELIEELNLIDANGKRPQELAELTGRQHAPMMGKWATPWGERHNIELERKRRLIKQVAHHLAALLNRDGSDGCYLAASKEISNQIIAELPRSARVKIEKIVACDLTKAEKVELLRHFEVSKPKSLEPHLLTIGGQPRKSPTIRQQL